MAKVKELSPRALGKATPRQLDEWLDERGIDKPPRATSEIVRQLLWEYQEGGGTVTTSQVPTTGGEEGYDGLKKPQLKAEADARNLEVERTDGDTEKEPRVADYVAALEADDAAEEDAETGDPDGDGDDDAGDGNGD